MFFQCALWFSTKSDNWKKKTKIFYLSKQSTESISKIDIKLIDIKYQYRVKLSKSNEFFHTPPETVSKSIGIGKILEFSQNVERKSLSILNQNTYFGDVFMIANGHGVIFFLWRFFFSKIMDFSFLVMICCTFPSPRIHSRWWIFC